MREAERSEDNQPLAIIGQAEYRREVMPEDGCSVGVVLLLGMAAIGATVIICAFLF